MPYALYPDELPVRLIRLRVERSDRHLYTELLSHCARNTTDGVIDVPLPMVTDHPEAEAAVDRLIEAGLLDRDGGDVVIVDYLAHQRSSAQVTRDREATRKRQIDYRERGKRHQAGDHSMCTKSCPEVRNGVTNAVSNGAQSNPIQSDPKRGLRLEMDRGSDGALGRATAPLSQTTDNPPLAPAHVFADLDLTGYCGVCDLAKSNRAHQKVSEAVEIAARKIVNSGGRDVVVTDIAGSDGARLYDVEARVCGALLKLQLVAGGTRLQWVQLHFPDAFYESAKKLGEKVKGWFPVGGVDFDGDEDTTFLSVNADDGLDLINALDGLVECFAEILRGEAAA